MEPKDDLPPLEQEPGFQIFHDRDLTAQHNIALAFAGLIFRTTGIAVEPWEDAEALKGLRDELRRRKD